VFKFCKNIILAIVLGLTLAACSQANDVAHIQDRRIVRNGVAERYIGTNLWYAGRLAGTEEGLARLRTELDTLNALGVNNLRVLAVEGEDIGNLRTALDEMAARGMSAVLFLNNAWEWSYGFGDYLERAGLGKTPSPKTDSYPAYMEAVSKFTTSEKAVELSHDHIRNIVSRLKDHKAIFSWQISNEPRCFSDDWATREAFVKYIHGTAALIKSIDPVHMVSTGNEGRMGCELDLELCKKINNCKDIDYLTIHIWPYNWGWVSEEGIADGVDAAIAETDKYIEEHLKLAYIYGKPMVIEEFGYPRDNFEFAKGTPTTGRDAYYAHVFNKVVESAAEDGLLAGCNFWGWGGFAEQNPDSIWWQEGDDLCGDPAQEQQGLNSVYMSDASTVAVIRNANRELAQMKRMTVQMQHNWIYSGKTPRRFFVDVYAPAGSELEVRLDLVRDLSLMGERDTVLTTAKTVSVKANGKASVGLGFEGLEPGFYQVNLSSGDYHYPLFNIGIDPGKIESPADRQPDFDEFWQQTLSGLAGVEMNLKMTLDEEHSNELRKSYIVEADSWNGGKIGGLLCVPVKEGKYPTFLDYMGYGADVYPYDPSANPEAVEFLVSVRDQGIFKNGQDRWIDRGLTSKEEFYYRGAFADVVRAIDLICSLDCVDTDNLYARGESQGGAFTFISAALDHRVKAIAPAVPFLGDFRDYSKIVWWPVWEVFEEADRQGIEREELFKMLSYFDVKNFMNKVECPVLMAFGLQDPTCPPHTNFAEYNLLKSPKSWYCAPRCGHGMWEILQWSEIRQNWFEKQIHNN